MKEKKKTILVCGSGPVPKEKISRLAKRADVVIAVNGGYDRITKIGVTPELVIGDMDSTAGVPGEINKITFPADKDKSDLQLCMDHVFKNYSEIGDIIIAGGISEERLDHSLANLLMCLSYDMNMMLVTGYSCVRILNCSGSYRYNARPGIRISILSIEGGEISGEGLKYELPAVFETPSRGISNIAIKKEISLKVKSGRWVVIFFDGDCGETLNC